MYALTIMAQPSPERITEMGDAPDMRARWNDIHRGTYLPFMHFMMFLSLVGLASSLRTSSGAVPHAVTTTLLTNTFIARNSSI
jgi:hypothetical protein